MFRVYTVDTKHYDKLVIVSTLRRKLIMSTPPSR